MSNGKSFKIDLNVREGHEGYHTVIKCPKPIGYKSLLEVETASSAGMSGVHHPKRTLTSAQQAAVTAKKQSRAFSMGVKPGQQLLMNAFMMYMSGSQLNIFSISVTSGAILGPLGSLLSMEQYFGSFNDVDVTTAKLAYVVLNLLWLAMGLYKMSSMRLLPTTAADWTSKIVWKEMLEQTSIPPAQYY